MNSKGIAVRRVKRHKIMGDNTSPELYYLRQKAGVSRTYNLGYVAREIETAGSMTAEDVEHVLKAFVRRLKIILTDGDRIKVDGLGTFFISFGCKGSAEEKDCTVKNIDKVNIRFMVDNKLRLVNDSIATTRGADNNVLFYIDSEVKAASGSGTGTDDDPIIDPNA